MICVNSVSVCPKNVSLKTGDWYYDAYAEVCPLDADCREVTWHSENPSVANVNASTGYIHANAIGTTKIYATATDGSECSDYLTVTVSNTVPVASITLNRSNISLEECGSTSLFATVCPENASNKNVNWTSSDSSVATVSDSGLVTAVSIGSAIITATAADGSGHCDCCTVTVTESILVSDICVSPSEINLKVNDSCYLYETVMPSNASNKNVAWHSDNTSVALVNSSGLVYANGVGSATIYATAQDGSGVCGSCDVSVSSLPVSSVSVCPDKKTLSVNDITTLCAIITPFNATNLSVEWTSSDTSVATVGRYTGIVTAKSDGTAIITARTVDGNKTDTCTITVDSREKVQIKKDSHSFYVEFEDGKIWKNIGLDLSKREENYNLMDPPTFWHENYEYLIEEEQRYFDNVYVEDVEIGEPIVEDTYSVKQIAYLYLLDPLGIEYYMKNHACHDKDIMSGEFLTYKDEVYEAIFGTSERSAGRFYFRIVDGVAQYGRYDEYDRMDIYSNAEVLFGFHTIFDWDWSTFIRTFIEGLFGMIPGVSEIQTGIQIYQSVFHSGSIFGVCSNEAASYVEEYVQESIEYSIEQKLGARAKKCAHWALNLILILADSTFSAFQIPNPKDIEIYNRISNIPDFLTIVDKYNGNLSVEEIIQEYNESQE